MAPGALARLRKVCLALPEAHEVEAWGAPTFRVRNKLFAMYSAPNVHHGDGRTAVWCKAPKGDQQAMIQFAPKRFFVPPYVGPSGWVGVWLDGNDVRWDEVGDILREAWRLTAPKTVVKALDAPAGHAPAVKKTAGKKPAAKKATARTATAGKAAAKKSTKRR